MKALTIWQPCAQPSAIRRLEPHAYAPDLMAMGDCIYCGRVAEDPIHLREQKPDPGRGPKQGVLAL